MRRAKVGAGSPMAESSDGPPSRLHAESGVEGARSAPSAFKLVLVVALISTLYTVLVVLGKERGGTPTVDLRAAPSTLAHRGQGANLRRHFRRLSMMGFEGGSGEGVEWRTCREYEEGKLGPHKKVRVLCIVPKPHTHRACFARLSGPKEPVFDRTR